MCFLRANLIILLPPDLSRCSFPQVPQHHRLVPVWTVWWSSSVSLWRVLNPQPGWSHLELVASFPFLREINVPLTQIGSVSDEHILCGVPLGFLL